MCRDWSIGGDFSIADTDDLFKSDFLSPDVDRDHPSNEGAAGGAVQGSLLSRCGIAFATLSSADTNMARGALANRQELYSFDFYGSYLIKYFWVIALG